MTSIDSLLAEHGLIKQDILNINKFELDKECVEISNIYDIVGELISYLEGERDSIELDKEEMYAELAIQYKKSLEAEESKTSDPKIKQMVIINGDYKAISRKYLELKLKCNLLKNVKESLYIKSGKLDTLTEQYKSNYFMLNVGQSKEGVKELRLKENRKLISESSSKKIPIL